MTWLRLVPWIIAVLALASAAWLWSANGALKEEVGALKHSNQQLSNTIVEKENAAKGRQQTNRAVRRMPPAEIVDRLR